MKLKNVSPFSPAPKYKKKELASLPADIFQGDQIIYYPGSQSDTSIIELAKASLSPAQFRRIKFVYQDPFYDRREIDRGRKLGYPIEWSHERLDKFMKKVENENITLIPNILKGNDLAEKADFIYLQGLPLYGDNFPFNIMSNARPGTYLIGLNLNLDEISFLFSGIQKIDDNIRVVKNPNLLSKYGNIYQISPEIGELVFEYKYNKNGFMEDGTINIDVSPKERQIAKREGKIIVTQIRVDLEERLRRGMARMTASSARDIKRLLAGEDLPKILSEMESVV